MTSPTIPVPTETVLGDRKQRAQLLMAEFEGMTQDEWTLLGLHMPDDMRATLAKLIAEHDARAASPALASPVPSDAGVNELQFARWNAENTLFVDGLAPSGGKDQEAVAGEAVAKAPPETRAWSYRLVTNAGASDWVILPRLEGAFVAEEGRFEFDALVPASALDAERAAHEQTKRELAFIEQTEKDLQRGYDDLDVKLRAAEARSALLEETAGKALDESQSLLASYLHFPCELTEDTNRQLAENRTTLDAIRAYLTQHKAPALPASDAEGGDKPCCDPDRYDRGECDPACAAVCFGSQP